MVFSRVRFTTAEKNEYYKSTNLEEKIIYHVKTKQKTQDVCETFAQCIKPEPSRESLIFQ